MDGSKVQNWQKLVSDNAMPRLLSCGCMYVCVFVCMHACMMHVCIHAAFDLIINQDSLSACPNKPTAAQSIQQQYLLGQMVWFRW